MQEKFWAAGLKGCPATGHRPVTLPPVTATDRLVWEAGATLPSSIAPRETTIQCRGEIIGEYID